MKISINPDFVKKMTGITIFYGDNIILYVVNTKKGLRLYFKQLPDNYQAKFELNLMSKFSNFIINKPFSAINNAARHIFFTLFVGEQTFILSIF